jgi:hypothetical protein
MSSSAYCCSRRESLPRSHNKLDVTPSDRLGPKFRNSKFVGSEGGAARPCDAFSMPRRSRHRNETRHGRRVYFLASASEDAVFDAREPALHHVGRSLVALQAGDFAAQAGDLAAQVGNFFGHAALLGGQFSDPLVQPINATVQTRTQSINAFVQSRAQLVDSLVRLIDADLKPGQTCFQFAEFVRIRQLSCSAAPEARPPWYCVSRRRRFSGSCRKICR